MEDGIGYTWKDLQVMGFADLEKIKKDLQSKLNQVHQKKRTLMGQIISLQGIIREELNHGTDTTSEDQGGQGPADQNH